jgi:hypothetical protein
VKEASKDRLYRGITLLARIDSQAFAQLSITILCAWIVYLSLDGAYELFNLLVSDKVVIKILVCAAIFVTPAAILEYPPKLLRTASSTASLFAWSFLAFLALFHGGIGWSIDASLIILTVLSSVNYFTILLKEK